MNWDILWDLWFCWYIIFSRKYQAFFGRWFVPLRRRRTLWVWAWGHRYSSPGCSCPESLGRWLPLVLWSQWRWLKQSCCWLLKALGSIVVHVWGRLGPTNSAVEFDLAPLPWLEPIKKEMGEPFLSGRLWDEFSIRSLSLGTLQMLLQHHMICTKCE